jgi:transposase-like protein
MKEKSTTTGVVATGLEAAWQNVAASFERFCLTAGVATLAQMMDRDTVALCGARHGRSVDRRGYRWARTTGKLGFHGGEVGVEWPRVRAREDGAELALPSWQAAQAEDWLGHGAMNLMLINVSTRRIGRAVRLPEGDLAAPPPGAGVSKSAVSRRFVALSAERMSEWMAADLSQLDLLAIQIDGMHVTSELTLLAAIGIDGEGAKHPLGLLEGASENAAVVQALLDNLIERGLDPLVLSTAI